jgi:hypothetical protein
MIVAEDRTMPIVKHNCYPERLKRSWAVKGIFTGGCVERGDGSAFRAKAHAHIKGPHEGWICVRAKWRLSDEALMVHELAHLVSGCGHNAKFRQTVLKLGGTLDPTPSLKSYRGKTQS